MIMASKSKGTMLKDSPSFTAPQMENITCYKVVYTIYIQRKDWILDRVNSVSQTAKIDIPFWKAQQIALLTLYNATPQTQTIALMSHVLQNVIIVRREPEILSGLVTKKLWRCKTAVPHHSPSKSNCLLCGILPCSAYNSLLHHSCDWTK
jgi:hypothetical protein